MDTFIGASLCSFIENFTSTFFLFNQFLLAIHRLINLHIQSPLPLLVLVCMCYYLCLYVCLYVCVCFYSVVSCLKVASFVYLRVCVASCVWFSVLCTYVCFFLDCVVFFCKWLILFICRLYSRIYVWLVVLACVDSCFCLYVWQIRVFIPSSNPSSFHVSAKVKTHHINSGFVSPFLHLPHELFGPLL